VFLVTAQGVLAYPLDACGRAGFMAVVIFVFVQLWSATLRLSGPGAVAGFDLRRIVWYLVVTETIVMSAPRLFERIDQEVKSGDLAYTLARPYNYAVFQYATYMGNALLMLPVNFAVGATLALLFVGTPPLGVAAWAGIAVAALLAISLNFAAELVIGLLAFWFEDTFAFFWIYQKLVFTLGGLFLPLSLFPSLLRRISAALPFSSIAYGPARLVQRFSGGTFLAVAGTQLLWLAVIGLVAWVIFRGGVRRLNVNGG
jgi:ABC-2 type transport system permease protein